MNKDDMKRLSRAIHPMPGDIWDALEKKGLLNAYKERPPYQRNDYIGWISRAKRPDTRRRRLEQMLFELEQGYLYMKMPWRPARRK